MKHEVKRDYNCAVCMSYVSGLIWYRAFIEEAQMRIEMLYI
jgi:hypothetical protein